MAIRKKPERKHFFNANKQKRCTKSNLEGVEIEKIIKVQN